MIQMISGACLTPTGLKRPSDGPFELTPDKEEFLVRRGVACYLVNRVEEPETAPDATGDDSLDLLEMTKAQLVDLAKSMGLDTKKCRNKADIVDLISQFNAEDDFGV